MLNSETYCGGPVLDIDPFNESVIQDPYSFHEAAREAGPIVWLPKVGAWCVARYEDVRKVLEDADTFCSGAGVGLSNFKKETPWRTPSLLLETDAPEHTRNRSVITRAVAPAALKGLREDFQEQAEILIAELVTQGTFDAATDLAEVYPIKVFGDAVGIRSEGRHHLLTYADMVFNAMGPRNERVENAMAKVEPAADWVWQSCQRHALIPGGFGTRIFESADAGTVSEHEAAMIVRSFLSAGLDTTVNGIGNAIYCFATNPSEWQKVLADPNLARSSFEEVMRCETVFQMFFRTTTRETTFGEVTINEGEKILVSLASANRDPRRYSDPNRFDISRAFPAHVGFGAGIHGCVGQMIARMETELIIRALAGRVKSIELLDGAKRRSHNIMRGFETLPIRVTT
jgi:4-methoxybenzoate monooxygenase (O-demethylating)